MSTRQRLTFVLGFFLISGCAGSNYIRSDVFLNSESVKSVYVMPIASEITIDPGVKITRDALKARIESSLQAVMTILKGGFVKRGYQVGDYNKMFSSLDRQDPNDQLIRQAVFVFFKPKETTSLFKVESKTKTQTEKSYDVGVQNFPTADYDPLVAKTLECLKALPSGVDTVVYISIKSKVAPRGLLNSISSESQLELGMQIIGLPEKTIIYSSHQLYEATDIIAKKKLLWSIEDFMKYMPVKLN